MVDNAPFGGSRRCRNEFGGSVPAETLWSHGWQAANLIGGNGKVRAAVDAKKDPDFVINARTDACAVYGIDEAIRRANAYLEAGADMIFLESPTSLENLKRGLCEIKGPVSINMLEEGKTPRLTFDELEELGAARVSCPMFASLVTAYALKEGFSYLKEHGTSVGYERHMPFPDFKTFTDTDLVRAMEKKYISDLMN